MVKKFLNWLLNFNCSKNVKEDCQIPETISGDERIVRVLQYPSHITKKDETIKMQAFRTPAGKDEVSVIRQSYSGTVFCKKWGQKIEVPEEGRKYFGLACLLAKEIREQEAEVIYTPKGNHFYHSDIKIGYIPIKGEPLPSKFSLKVDTLAKTARLYKDPNPPSNDWQGEEVL